MTISTIASTGITQRIARARKLKGEVHVPGEIDSAALALLMAAVSDGDCEVDNVPPGSGRLISWLRSVGVKMSCSNSTVVIRGDGLRSLRGIDSLVDLTDTGNAAPAVLAILAGQGTALRARVSDTQRQNCARLVELLSRAGVSCSVDPERIFTFDGNDVIKGVAHDETDLKASVKLALLIAGLYCDGPTVVREPLSSKDRVDQVLKLRGVTIAPSRSGDVRTMTIEPGQQIAGLSLSIPGQLRLALPLIVAASCLRGSRVRIENVELRSSLRSFLDLLRQIGGVVETEDCHNGAKDLIVSTAKLKATRVADKRVEPLLDDLAMLSVLATQVEGEFIIRDLDVLRQGNFDLVGHVVSVLRSIGAKVGEYPQGIVIEGGRPLTGTEIDCRNSPALTMAFAVVGLLAEGQTELNDSGCMKPIFPGFYDVMASLQGKRKGGVK